MNFDTCRNGFRKRLLHDFLSRDQSKNDNFPSAFRLELNKRYEESFQYRKERERRNLPLICFTLTEYRIGRNPSPAS